MHEQKKTEIVISIDSIEFRCVTQELFLPPKKAEIAPPPWHRAHHNLINQSKLWVVCVEPVELKKIVQMKEVKEPDLLNIIIHAKEGN